MIDDRISDLIRGIYRGAHDATEWDRALDGMLAATGSRFVMVSTVDIRGGAYNASRFYGADDARFLDGVEDYESHLYRDDPSLNFALARPHAGSVRLRDLISADTAGDVERRYERWLRSELAVGDSQVFYTPQTDGLVLGVSLHTSCDRPGHSANERALFALLFGHIDNAFRLIARPPQIEGAEAIVVLGRAGRVRHASDTAAALFERNDGLTVVRQRVRTAYRADQARLDALIAAAIRPTEAGAVAGSIAVARPSGQRPLLVTARPLPPESGLAQTMPSAAVLRILDPEERLPADPRWAAMFGLTPAETRLAQALLNDDRGLRATAATLGIAYATARVQLASIFDKTRVRTQAQLLRLLTMLSRG